MKKYAKPISLIALVLAITFIFSGCGLINFAASILKKDNTNSTTGNLQTTVPAGDVVYDNVQPTDSAVISPPSDTTSDTQTSSGTTSSATTTVLPPETTKDNSSTQTGTSTSTTTAPADDDFPSADEIKEMPLKDVQDLLFASQDADKTVQILNACGFEYDEVQGIYYSSVNPWQKGFGFNIIYDMAAPIAGMHYDTERIQFNYDNKAWMIQLWKGQYGATVGAEIGVYNKTDKIMQYDCVSEEEFLEMSFVLYNQGEKLFERGPEKHWWLTGFKIFNVGVPILLDMDMTIKFPTKAMADAFEKGLKKSAADNLLDPMTYSRTSLTFKIHW